MNRPVAVLDACVLVPIRLATTLLWLAEAGLFEPLWSDAILEEVQRNLPRVSVTPEQARRRVAMMRAAFDPEALVDGFEHLVDDMTCHPKDRHVLAAAVAAGADTIVTFNLRDFPEEATGVHDVQAVHPDRFLCQMLAADADTVVDVLRRETAALSRPPEKVTEFLATLTTTVPTFANLAADAAADLPEAISPVPALVQAEPSEALAALGQPGDLTNPVQVASAWWASLSSEDLDTVRALTVHPGAWDYEWTTTHLAGRSLASKVLRAVDAPDRIAFMRFVPMVTTASRVFQPFVTGVTFLTLVEMHDGTWRVWGLGPATPSASDITGGRRSGDGRP